VVDVHESSAALDWIGDKGKGYSAIIVGGDLARMGSKGFSSKFLTRALSACRSVLFVPGNADDPGESPPAGVVNLHGQRIAIGGCSVGGLGGSNPTPFQTPFEMKDDEARSVLSRLGRVDVLVSHCPPLDTMCDRAGERHIGSLPVREYILQRRPKIVLSGHAHESKAKDTLESTTLVNPGPLMNGNFAEVGLGREITVELKGGWARAS